MYYKISNLKKRYALSNKLRMLFGIILSVNAGVVDCDRARTEHGKYTIEGFSLVVFTRKAIPYLFQYLFTESNHRCVKLCVLLYAEVVLGYEHIIHCVSAFKLISDCYAIGARSGKQSLAFKVMTIVISFFHLHSKGL